MVFSDIADGYRRFVVSRSYSGHAVLVVFVGLLSLGRTQDTLL